MSYEFTGEAGRCLDAFLSHVNRSMLHPLDWGRLYRFARACHLEGVSTDEGEVKRRMLEAGFSETKADEVASVFYHLMAFQAV